MVEIILFCIALLGLFILFGAMFAHDEHIDVMMTIGLVLTIGGLCSWFIFIPDDKEEIINILEDRGVDVVEVDMDLSTAHIRFDDDIYSCDFIKLNRDTVLLDSKSECKKFEGKELVAK